MGYHTTSPNKSNGDGPKIIHPEGTFYTNFSRIDKPVYERAVRLFKETYPNATIEFIVTDMPHYVLGTSQLMSALVWNHVFSFNNVMINQNAEEWLAKYAAIFRSITK